MKRYIRKLRHFILFAVLIGTDILIGFYGHFSGSGHEFSEYVQTVTLDDLFPVIAIAIFVILFVEWLFRGEH